MKSGVSAVILAVSLTCGVASALASADVADAVGAPALMGWSTGGFAPDPPPPPLPADCQPDSTDPTCHPPPPPVHHHHGFL
jgi:hypothetical protein